MIYYVGRERKSKVKMSLMNEVLFKYIVLIVIEFYPNVQQIHVK